MDDLVRAAIAALPPTRYLLVELGLEKPPVPWQPTDHFPAYGMTATSMDSGLAQYLLDRIPQKMFGW